MPSDDVKSEVYRAVLKGQRDEVRRLLLNIPSGIDVEWETPAYGHRNLLILAAGGGDADMVRSVMPLVSATLTAPRGETALMLATEEGHVDVVKMLLPISEPNAVNEDGMTALMLASAKGFDTIVALLHPVSDALIADRGGENAIVLAIRNNHASTVELLWPAYQGLIGEFSTVVPIFVTAALRGMLTIVERCRPMIVTADWSDEQTLNRALDLAADNNHMNVVDFLLDHGANPNGINPIGWTPLMTVAHEGHERMVARLAPITNVLVVEKKGYDALDLAMQRQKRGCAEALVPFLPKERLTRAIATYDQDEQWAPIVRRWEATLLRDTLMDVSDLEKMAIVKARPRL